MGKLLIAFGIIFIAFSLFFFWQRYNPQRLSFNINNYSGKTTDSASLPIEIIIPAINLKLPVIPASLKNNNWEATTQGVSYLSSSPIPGSLGNSILYGHNWPNLLGNITKLKPGQIIQIKLANGEIKKFAINTISEVSPQQTSILDSSKDARITLYTCTGFWDEKRFVVVAK